MKYQFIREQGHDYPIVVLCRVLEVAQSGYYAWKKHQPSARQQKDAHLGIAIKQIYIQGRLVYGSPRIHAALHHQGIDCGRKRGCPLDATAGIDGGQTPTETANDRQRA